MLLYIMNTTIKNKNLLDNNKTLLPINFLLSKIEEYIGTTYNDKYILEEIILNGLCNITESTMCIHDIIEDHIERGIDKEMLKICYCCKCEMTF